MTSSLLPVIAALLVILLILTEIVAAVLPLIVVLVFVPEQERDALARLIAACDSSRKLRVWPALRLAVRQRRRERRRGYDATPADLAQLINPPYGSAVPGPAEINTRNESTGHLA
jgi:hypothetical protein